MILGLFGGLSVKRLLRDMESIERTLATHGENIANAMADRTKAIAELGKELDTLADMNAKVANLLPDAPASQHAA